MRQFDVYPNLSKGSRAFAPFVVVPQTHYLTLDTVVAAPLVNDKQATSVEIAVQIKGQSLVVAITEMG